MQPNVLRSTDSKKSSLRAILRACVALSLLFSLCRKVTCDARWEQLVAQSRNNPGFKINFKNKPKQKYREERSTSDELRSEKSCSFQFPLDSTKTFWAAFRFRGYEKGRGLKLYDL